MTSKKPSPSNDNDDTIKTGGVRWECGEVDVTLNRLMEADSQERFNGLCDVCATQMYRGHRPGVRTVANGELVRRYLWGLAAGVVAYHGPTGKRAAPLPGKPLTWAEDWMVKTACQATTKEKIKQPPTIERTAQILARHPDDLRRAWNLLAVAGKSKPGLISPGLLCPSLAASSSDAPSADTSLWTPAQPPKGTE